MISSKDYIPGFDGLRAVAIVLVILEHLSYKIFPGGGIGVDIFFVLSGYLITTILIRENKRTGSIRLGNFYGRRFLRLAPALITMVVIITGISLATGAPNKGALFDGMSSLAYIMDYVRAFSHASDPSFLGHTWSLAVEEQFYLVWPILLILIYRTRPSWRLAAVFAVLVALQLWNLILVMGLGSSFERVSYAFDTRAVQLMVGCALAVWLDVNPNAGWSRGLSRLWPVAAAGIAFIVVAVHPLGDPGVALRFIVIAALVAIVLLQILSNPTGLCSRVLSLPPLVWLGRISYGVYLWHYPLLLIARFYVDHNRLLAAGAVLLAIPVAALSYHFIEQPFLRLKDRLEPRFAGQPMSSAPPVV